MSELDGMPGETKYKEGGRPCIPSKHTVAVTRHEATEEGGFMSGRRWTQEELDQLERMSGTYTVATIAKKLGRSFDAVNIKLQRMGLSGFEKSTDLLTMNQMCLMLGVQSRTVKKKWKSKGLRIMRKGNYLTIRQEELIKYLKNHPEDWSAADITDDSLIMRYPWYKEKKKTDVKSQYHWTSVELSKLKLLRHEGYSIREIAEQMGRSESSIKYKLYYPRRK